MAQQLSELEAQFKTKAAAAISNLDATSLHGLANELDKIKTIAANLTAVQTDLAAVEPTVTIADTTTAETTTADTTTDTSTVSGIGR
jgi:hypothetical protein